MLPSIALPLWHSILETLASRSHGNVGLFLEGLVLTKSDEKLFFTREISIASVNRTCGFGFVRVACSH